MKVTHIQAYCVERPRHEGSNKWSDGKSASVFDTTVAAVETDAVLTGYGEVCPLDPLYLPAYAEGVRAVDRNLPTSHRPPVGFDSTRHQRHAPLRCPRTASRRSDKTPR